MAAGERRAVAGDEPLEVGPGAVLTRLADAILAETSGAEGAEAFALDPSGGRRPGVLDLGDSLARLAALPLDELERELAKKPSLLRNRWRKSVEEFKAKKTK